MRYLLLCLCLLINAYSQSPSEKQDFTIKIGVEEVRLDAVVLDRKGNPITDLTADDFEIRQDGKPQKVTSCIYMNLHQPKPANNSEASIKSKLTPLVSSPALKREEVRRTIIFLVDNSGMSFIQLNDTRMAMRKFVETQMQPGDLISIIRTENGNAATELFTSDKRQLYSLIDNVWWSMGWFESDPTREGKALYTLLSAIRYCINGLHDMPGHKSLILVSPRARLPLMTTPGLIRYFDVLADDALRADVVVHTLNIQALYNSFENTFAAEIGKDCISKDNLGRCFGVKTTSYANGIPNAYSGWPIPLSQKTGGAFVENSNFFVTPSGVGRANGALKGYYLLTYIPPSDTFKDSESIYRKLKLKVNRRGTEVYSRDGFFGKTKAPDETGSIPRSLKQAIFSPFRYNGIGVNLSSGHTYDLNQRCLVSAWLNLDGKDLTAFEEADGSRSLALAIQTLIADTEDQYQYSREFPFYIRISDKDLERIRRTGLPIHIYTPIKNPGDYYVRAAVKDRVSGKIGSAYQFLRISDLQKNRLSLSNIFILNPRETASFIESGRFDASDDESKIQVWHSLREIFSFRCFWPGDSFEYGAVVSRSKFDKDQTPQLSIQSTIFKDGKEISKTVPEGLDLVKAVDYGRIPVIKKLNLHSNMDPGFYVLQITVTEKKAGKKSAAASQAIDFEIRKE